MESLAHSWCLIAVVTVLSLGADPLKVAVFAREAAGSALVGWSRASHLASLCRELLIRLGRNYICTVPETLLLIHDTVPAGG